jgi:hypothetical protein
MDKHTKKHRKPKMWKQQKALCYEHKNAISLEETNVGM